MTELRHELTELEMTEKGKTTYGGNQMMFRDKVRKRCGCGLVAGLELILYIHRYHNCRIDFLKNAEKGPMTPEEYEAYAIYLQEHGMPLIYPLGVNAFTMVASLNLIFIRNKAPFRAVWCMSAKKIWTDIENMLEDDLPVIMCAGNNFPNIFGKKKVNLYSAPDGFEKTAPRKVKAHYFIVTGMDTEWIRISSWGKCFWIRKSEFEEYMKIENSIFSTVLRIERKADGIKSKKF